eukprot:TRINITY_DN4170_c0_g1_i2.p1 TRINITY_DN4170_c0_g1~~TRINITY_DN4170_c0_g1_i2.p1  ORF type:complete len:357 (-),score=53.58 TRINITY_DN4170_c0_g1_i2:91-1161(-)
MVAEVHAVVARAGHESPPKASYAFTRPSFQDDIPAAASEEPAPHATVSISPSSSSSSISNLSQQKTVRIGGHEVFREFPPLFAKQAAKREHQVNANSEITAAVTSSVSSNQTSTQNAKTSSLRKWMFYFIGCGIVIFVWAICLIAAKVDFPWFIYPILIFSLVLQYQIFRERAKDPAATRIDQLRCWFYFHLLVYLSINTTVTVTWLFTTFQSKGGHFPWLMYPIVVLALPLVFHGCRLFVPKQPYWPHLAMYLLVGCMLVLTWYESPGRYPWFAWILGFWALAYGIVGAVSWYRNRERSKTALLSSSRRRSSVILSTRDVELPAPVIIDIPPPSYQVTSVSAQDFALFPDQVQTL